MRSRFAARAAKKNRRKQLLARAPRISPTIEAAYVMAMRRQLKAFHGDIRRAYTPQERHDSFASAFLTLAARARKAAEAFRATAFQVAKRLEKFSKAEAVRTLGDLASDLSDTVTGFAEGFAADAVEKLGGLMSESLEEAEDAYNASLVGEEVGAFNFDGILEAWISRGINSARNMVTQGTAELNQARQVDVGVTQYVWITQADDRVRSPTGPINFGHHLELEGKTCNWDDPPLTADKSSSGEPCHPGDDYGCRCLASPIISMVAESASDDEEAA